MNSSLDLIFHHLFAVYSGGKLSLDGAGYQPNTNQTGTGVGTGNFMLTLKAPRKNVSEKLCLLKSSAANNCLILLKNSSIEANRMDPDQTVPIGAV